MVRCSNFRIITSIFRVSQVLGVLRYCFSLFYRPANEEELFKQCGGRTAHK